ncbi:Lrp/AsnC family transcriptional regulator [Microbaculum sp. FT89]|uniref:Lrp/AsnC family transcriptional regulator n=1 Tax=Microbaculum sp. FT89 TaxID=3447298 RepID=UPI003F5318DD
MDEIDRKIAEILQTDGRAASVDIASAVGVSTSTANERVRRLVANGTITEWRGVLNPEKVGAALCVFVFLDLAYDGEAEACRALMAFPEVQELHHISGQHSYLMKVRVRDTNALQQFLQSSVKPLRAVQRTETIVSLDALKETTVVKISPDALES